jgi:hypothetical protein
MQSLKSKQPGDGDRLAGFQSAEVGADDDAIDEDYRRLAEDADLLDHLVGTIRKTEPKDDEKLIALIREVDSREQLKKGLEQLISPTTEPDRGGSDGPNKFRVTTHAAKSTRKN